MCNPCLITFLLFITESAKGQTLEEPSNDTGQDDSSLRVVQGWLVQLGVVPYQVSFKANLQTHFDSFCGGTLIARSKILTAAHCFSNDKVSFCLRKTTLKAAALSRYAAVMGNLKNRDTYNKKGGNTGQWRRLLNFTRPGNYKFPVNDIGIVFTMTPFDINDNVKPITYATKNEDYRGSCLVSGYGLTGPYTDSPRSAVLLAGYVDLPNQNTCNRLFMRRLKNELCGLLDKSYPARGDSGGPLVCKGTGNPNEDPEMGILVGIVSSYLPHRACSFTRVSAYSQYIALNGGFCTVPLGIVLAVDLFVALY